MYMYSFIHSYIHSFNVMRGQWRDETPIIYRSQSVARSILPSPLSTFLCDCQSP